MSDELQVVKSEAMPAVSTPSVAHMLQAVLERGVTEANVAAVDKLCLLLERMEARDSEKQFAQAFTALQQELPAVQATKPVPAKDGSIKYHYAPYSDVMKQVQPFLTKYGFSVRFSSKADANRITMECTLMHSGGHSVKNEFSVRVGSGPPGASESQADGSAASYAQRGVLCDALNVIVRMDDDARLEGAPVSPEQAASLKKRVMDTGSDVDAFLRYAGAASFEAIPSARYALLDQSLRKKERTS